MGNDIDGTSVDLNAPPPTRAGAGRDIACRTWATRPMLPTCSVSPRLDAAAIRAAFDQGGEFSAAVELRRLFPGVLDNRAARDWARTIAGWRPLGTLTPRD